MTAGRNARSAVPTSALALRPGLALLLARELAASLRGVDKVRRRQRHCLLLPGNPDGQAVRDLHTAGRRGFVSTPPDVRPQPASQASQAGTPVHLARRDVCET